MTGQTHDAAPPGLADLSLDVRRAREIESDRETQEGLTRRHLAVAAYERAYLAVQLDRLLRAGPALAAKLRGG